MPEVSVVNSEGSEVGKMALSPTVFEIEPNMAIMHRGVLAHRAAKRSGTADTKTRAEVAGGGKKPYRQKGTGRARQGTVSAPHYAGGGVVFGPHPRDYDVKMPKKMKRLALRSALSARLAEGRIKVVDDLKIDSISTKKLSDVLIKVGAEGKTVLLTGAPDDLIQKSGRNIPWLVMRVVPMVCAYDLLDANTVIATKDALTKIEEAQGL